MAQMKTGGKKKKKKYPVSIKQQLNGTQGYSLNPNAVLQVCCLCSVTKKQEVNLEFKRAPSSLTVYYGKRPSHLCVLRVNQTTATTTGSGAKTDLSHNANSLIPLKHLHWA